MTPAQASLLARLKAAMPLPIAALEDWLPELDAEFGKDGWRLEALADGRMGIRYREAEKK